MVKPVKRIIKRARVVILIIALVLALVALQFNLTSNGIAIRTVTKNSASDIAGVELSENSQPMSKEVIIEINNQKINNVEEYYDFVSTLRVNQSFTMKTVQRKACIVFTCLTNKYNSYKITALPKYNITILPETEFIDHTESVFNETLNKTVNITTTVEQNKTIKELIGVEDIGMGVYAAPVNNIKKGLDLQGGTRVLLKLDEPATNDQMELVLSNIKERLNVYGLSDVIVREIKGFAGTGDQYILAEVAGITNEEIRDLIAKQGKFEAKIGDEIIFRGGQDITYVARSGDESGLEYGSCGQALGSEVFSCRFRFGISLTPEAAQKQADTTETLEIVSERGEEFLSESLILYLDDELVDSLRIGAELKGNPVTEISISGSGVGSTMQAAQLDAITNMKRLQTILITGSLPVKLSIVKTDTLSPTLGSQFVKNVMLVGLLAILGVALVIFIRYRDLKVSIPVIITMISEVFILLGFAALVGWNLDIAAIAGILVAVGTGVDDQIIITDETLNKKSAVKLSWKEKLKKAFFIMLAAYATTMFAMIPLYFAGAGLVKGFALTTMAGVTIGILITRPAFASIIEELYRE